MSIQELTISGFRSLKETTWAPGSLNLVVGPNGSGKSNLIRCLELISNVARGRLQKSLPDGVVPVLWDHRSGSCGWKLRIDPVDEGRDRLRDALTFEFEFAQLRHTSAYEIVGDSLGNWQKFNEGTDSSPYWIFRRDRRKAYLFDQQQQELVALGIVEEDASEDMNSFDENESLLSQIADSRNRIPDRVRRTLEGWNIYHDVHAERGSAMRQPATTQFTKKLAHDGSNLATVLHTLYTSGGEFRDLIDEGMRAGFGDEYVRLEFQPAAAQQIQLAVQWKSSSQPHAGSDLSDGTLRFLFLLTVLSNPEPAALIAIDEPETGLHPSMLPIVAEYAAMAAEKTQVVLTSHSPEFLDAFVDPAPSVTLCHWAEGESHLYQLAGDGLSRWLEKYRLGHLFTQGDLEALVLPDVEPVDDGEGVFDDLPSEDELMALASDAPKESKDE